MSKTGLFIRPKNNRFIKIEEWQRVYFNGDFRKAFMLSIAEWKQLVSLENGKKTFNLSLRDVERMTMGVVKKSIASKIIRDFINEEILFGYEEGIFELNQDKINLWIRENYIEKETGDDQIDKKKVSTGGQEVSTNGQLVSIYGHECPQVDNINNINNNIYNNNINNIGTSKEVQSQKQEKSLIEYSKQELEIKKDIESIVSEKDTGYVKMKSIYEWHLCAMFYKLNPSLWNAEFMKEKKQLQNLFKTIKRMYESDNNIDVSTEQAVYDIVRHYIRAFMEIKNEYVKNLKQDKNSQFWRDIPVLPSKVISCISNIHIKMANKLEDDAKSIELTNKFLAISKEIKNKGA